MSRDTVASVTSAAQLPVLRYRLLVEVWSLSTGPLFACTGGNFIYTGANTYSPVGQPGTFVGIEAVQEDVQVFPRAVRAWMAIVNTAALADVVALNLFNKPLKVYRAFLDQNLTVVGTPQLLWRGKIDTTKLIMGDPSRGNHLEIQAESRLQQQPRAQYFDQQTMWNILGNSGDTYFQYLPQIPLFRAPWGGLAYGISYNGTLQPVASSNFPAYGSLAFPAVKGS